MVQIGHTFFFFLGVGGRKEGVDKEDKTRDGRGEREMKKKKKMKKTAISVDFLMQGYRIRVMRHQ